MTDEGGTEMRRYPPWLPAAIGVAILAGVLVVALVVSGLLSAPGGTAGEPVASATVQDVPSTAATAATTPGSPAATSSPAPTETPMPEPGWEFITIGDIDDVRGVVELDGRLVAAGSTRDAEQPTPRIAWSDDGVEWTPVDLSHLGSVPAAIYGAVAGPAGFVAMGLRFEEQGIVPGVPFLLFSPDGTSWEEPAYPGGCPRSLTAVAGDFEYLLLGPPECGTEPGPDPRPLTALRSADGRRWQTASIPNSFEDPYRKPSTLATDGVRLAGVGFDAGLWLSEDGGKWSARDDAFGAGFTAESITYGSERWVVVGTRLSEGAQPVHESCASSDLETWACRATADGIQRAHATATGFVSIMTRPRDPSAPSPVDVSVLTSTDGLAWEGGVAPELEDISFHDFVFPTSRGVFAAGFTSPNAAAGTAAEPRVAVHRAPLPPP